jgi:hypothetical protein
MATDRFGVKQLYSSLDNGRKWDSVSWNNKKTRTVTPNKYDPYDSELGVCSGNIKINGKGTATIAPKTSTLTRGQRTYISGPWRNTEMTVYVKVRGQCPSFQMRSRSNHDGCQGQPYGFPVQVDGQSVSCGFGNYLVKWSDNNDNKVMCEVEPFHSIYKRALNKHDSVQPPLNIWTGYKQVTGDYGTDKVKVEGYILRDVANQEGWFKDVEYLFDGTNANIDMTGKEGLIEYCRNSGDKVSGDVNKNTVWRNSGKWCWLRFEGLDRGIWDIDLKYFSVREIEPLS